MDLQTPVTSCCSYDRLWTAQTNCRGRAGYRVAANRYSQEMLGFHDCSLRAARSAVGVADKVRIIWDPERETRIGQNGE